MLTAEQLVAAQRANVETLLTLTEKAFEGIEKLIELNLQVAKTTMSETAENTKAALSAKDAQQLLALQASLLQPAAEKAAAYSRHLYDIAASVNGELARVVEAQSSEAQRNFMTAVDTAAQNAPVGSQSAVALVKSAVAAANNAYDNVNKAAKQAADIAEANFQALTSGVAKATQQAGNAAKPAAPGTPVGKRS